MSKMKPTITNINECINVVFRLKISNISPELLTFRNMLKFSVGN